jgi:hypothetical protein
MYSCLLMVYLTTLSVAQTTESNDRIFFFFGATAPIWALAYLHETLYFISVF